MYSSSRDSAICIAWNEHPSLCRRGIRQLGQRKRGWQQSRDQSTCKPALGVPPPPDVERMDRPGYVSFHAFAVAFFALRGQSAQKVVNAQQAGLTMESSEVATVAPGKDGTLRIPASLRAVLVAV